ncbi:MAG: bifunctional folylpolyglutamate synthase/dihydrofolate synthase [Lachnospiraceae bacterium]|nr:bifunctional folylpolyglutamate synthase/dihydrofolate synthase [Lachnospiraceae bacterium]
MTYNQASEYIEECLRFGSVPGLDSITELCHRLGDPQDELKYIHIAGTNGKGSILAYTSEILKTAGLRVGRYISPTISSYLERFDVGGKPMSKTAFAKYIETVRPVCEQMAAEGLPHPTAFEIETAIAFLYFKDKNCDIVVLECGMGGRLDATNIIKGTLVSVFAHIDMDHMQFLGNTLTEIAAEKSGIIRKGIPIVTGPQKLEAMKVLINKALSEDCSIYAVTDDEDLKQDNKLSVSYITDVKCSLKGGSFSVRSDIKHKYKTPLLGTHQIYNAAVAAEVIRALKAMCEDATVDVSDRLRGIVLNKLTDEMINKGLADTKWPGRLQIISNKPLVIIDGAHNPDAATRLKESLDALIPDKHRILIMGMLKDKDIDAVAHIMCKDASMIMTVTPPDNPRALRSVELAETVRKYNANVTSLDSIEEAVEMATLCSIQDDKSVIIAFGSLSYMGRMIKIYSDNKISTLAAKGMMSGRII